MNTLMSAMVTCMGKKNGNNVKYPSFRHILFINDIVSLLDPFLLSTYCVIISHYRLKNVRYKAPCESLFAVKRAGVLGITMNLHDDVFYLFYKKN